MFSIFFRFYRFFIIIVLLICLLFCPIMISFNYNNTSSINSSNIFSSYDFQWPIPGYTSISSPFGKRASPTSGASTYHSGIDIPAPEGTKLYAISDGVVFFSSWGAGGGYTISYELSNHENIKISYCHVSPIMYVSVGDSIKKGQLIGSVGPKNVYGIQNNPYKDSNGNPTNGASTGCHLHFTLKINNNAVNPLDFFTIGN